jgi:hypothetical protein
MFLLLRLAGSITGSTLCQYSLAFPPKPVVVTQRVLRMAALLSNIILLL